MDIHPKPNNTDYAVLRAGLLSVIERLTDVKATAWSRDGLVKASVNGRGKLIELFLDSRIFRNTDSVALARDIVDAMHRAGELAAEHVSALTATALPVTAVNGRYRA